MLISSLHITQNNVLMFSFINIAFFIVVFAFFLLFFYMLVCGSGFKYLMLLPSSAAFSPFFLFCIFSFFLIKLLTWFSFFSTFIMFIASNFLNTVSKKDFLKNHNFFTKSQSDRHM